MPRLKRIAINRIDPKLECKSLISRNKQIAEFDKIEFRDFRLNFISCVLYGIAIVKGLSREKKEKRMRSCYNEARGVLFSHPSWKKLDFYAFVERVQEEYSEYRIILFKNFIGHNILYSGPLENDQNIYMVQSDKEKKSFNVLRYPAAFFGQKFICPICLKFARNKATHSCIHLCARCEKQDCIVRGRHRLCKKCNRRFKSKNCFENHIENDLCNKKRRCEQCFREYRVVKKTPHTCGFEHCSRCKIPHELGRCFVVAGQPDKESVYRKAIYFDIETIVCEKNELEPVLLVCAYYDNTGELIFKKFDRFKFVICDFISFLLDYDIKLNKYIFKDYVVVAHNFQGFDGVFIAKEFKENRAHYSIRTIFNGDRLQMLNVNKPNIRFLDSLNFVHCSLRNFSKMFNIPQSKSYFPYQLLTKQTIGYKGALPSIDKYDIDQLTVEDRKNFFNFYKAQKKRYRKKMFVTKSVLLTYCKQDVKVLAMCMEQYRKLMFQKTNFDPLEKDITLAGVCLRDFLENHLQPYSLGVIPAKGYFKCSNQSQAAYDFLAYKSYILKCEFRTSKHPKGEKQIGPFKVDGYSKEKKIIYDFHGCYYHGCKSCFSFNDYLSNRVPMTQLYENTKIREIEIRALIKENPKFRDFKYVSIWEHQFEEIKKSKSYLNYLKTTKQAGLSKETDATISERGFFYGGRTNTLQFYLKRSKRTWIKYKDICSLYPFVNKYFPYPDGHPIIIRSNFNYTPYFYFGVIKCKILPPKNLFHPVLPSRVHNKNMFVLCCACAVLENTATCTHTEDERCLYGEWCSPEVYKAMQYGYKLIEIYCVLHYENKIEYKGESESGLFGQYIDKWLKTKIEASGFPPHATTEVAKDAFILEYKLQENITLKKSNIKFNPGMRALAKLSLNSLWGRIGMEVNKTITDIVPVDQMINFEFNSGLKVVNYWPLKPGKVMLTYKKVNEACVANQKGNVVVAAFVTTWARLYLYDVLAKLGERAVYMDTDSIIYTHREGEYEPVTGDKLGEWTDEIPSGVHIKEFVSTGPKSYAYRLSDGSVKIKSKGISQNYNTKDVLSFESMKNGIDEMVRNKTYQLGQGIVVEKNLHFVRNKFTSKICKIPSSKKLTFRYNKNVKFRDKRNVYITYPYGYK